MDMWKYFDITHRQHRVCNPMSLEKIEELIALLPLKPGRETIGTIPRKRGERLVERILRERDAARHPSPDHRMQDASSADLRHHEATPVR